MSISPGELVELLAGQPRRAGLLCDFDGTLAEIVEDPATAAPLPGVRALLASLARRLALVGIVSGRPLDFLADALGEESRSLVLFGLYGAEHRGAAPPGAERLAQSPQSSESPESPQLAPSPEPARLAPSPEPAESPGLPGLPVGAAADGLSGRWRAALAQAVAEVGELPAGAELEVKPSSFALHWRRAPELGAALEARGAEVAERHGLVIRPAKMAIEVFPPGQSDKGRAVASLAQGLGAACFIGDDHGDLAAFRALADLGTTGLRFARVAVRSPESPAELLDEADLVVDGPPAVRELLARIERRLSGS